MTSDDSKPVQVKLHLLNNASWTIPLQPTVCCKDVVFWICKNVGLQDPEWASRFFTLYECVDGFTLGGEVPLREKVVCAYERCSKLYFAQKLFTTASMSTLDPHFIELRFAQAVYDIMSGRLPCPLVVLIQLCALRLQVTFGNNATVHKNGFLASRLLEILPATEIRRQDPATWERQLLTEHFQYDGTNPMLDFVRLVSELSAYGLSVFEVTTPNHIQQLAVRPLDASMTLGIGARGLVFLKSPELEEMTSFSLEQLVSWGFTPNETFWFEATASTIEDATRFEFETSEGHVMSQLLTDYVAEKKLEDGYHVEFHQVGRNESKESVREQKQSIVPSEVNAATRIQALFRGYLFRRNLEYLYGTVRIQSIWRGHVARCKFEEKLMELAATGSNTAQQQKEEAATTVQSCYRGYCVRRDILDIDEQLAATQIQAAYRGVKARRKSP